MGFNKRIVNKESILITEEGRLEKLFDADALIMDQWSSQFLSYFIKGYKKDEIIKILENGEN